MLSRSNKPIHSEIIQNEYLSLFQKELCQLQRMTVKKYFKMQFSTSVCLISVPATKTAEAEKLVSTLCEIFLQ